MQGLKGMDTHEDARLLSSQLLAMTSLANGSA